MSTDKQQTQTTDSLFRARRVQTLQAWENVIREKDARISRLESALRSIIATWGRDDSMRLLGDEMVEIAEEALS